MKHTTRNMLLLVILPVVYFFVVWIFGNTIAKFEIEQNPYEHPVSAALFFFVATLFGALAWVAGCVIMLIRIIQEFRNSRKVPKGNICEECGYPLAGLKSAMCPECGESLSMMRSRKM